MPADDMQRPVVKGSPGGAHRVQAVTNPAFASREEVPTTSPTSPASPTEDLLPPLATQDFPSLEEMDPAWLRWEETPVDVKTLCRTHDLPQVVKVDDGDYGNFGMGTQVDVARPFLLYASRRCTKALVANIYWDDQQQLYVQVGPRVVIPVNYPGWFYFLQDSGAVGKTLKSIKEVVALHPKAFLIRVAIPCYRRAVGRTKPTKNSNMRVYVCDQLPEGEVLNFGAIHSECVEQTKPTCCFWSVFGKKTTTYVSEEQYLRCTDLDGREVLLDLSLEGQFSPVGEPGTKLEDCVYQLADVVATSDLPTHVKLCCGQPPSSPCSFTGLLRLEDVYLEETVIACTLGAQRHFMVEFPTDSDIKFIISTDAYRYFDHPVIQKSMKQCEEQIDGYVNSIKVVQSFYPDHIKLKDTASKEDTKNVRSLPPLPTSHPVSSHNESMDTTDDYTDDSDFSDCTDDEENGGRSQTLEISQPHNNTIRSAVTVKISNDPVIIYDDNYEEIPGNRTQADPPRPAPPPIPTPVQTPIAVPPPPPMFDETLEETYDIADHVVSLPPMVHASYSRAKLERTASHPETVLANGSEDIIAPPQKWSDAAAEVPKVVNHPKPTSSVSNSVRMFNERSNSNMSNGVSPTTPLGCQLRERLDAFLTDSVQELHRMKVSGSTTPGHETPMSTASADQANRNFSAPKIPPKPRGGSVRSPQALQSHEDVSAFLDNIFNPDSMTDEAGPMKPRNQTNVYSGTLPHPRGRHLKPVSGNSTVYRSMDDSFQSKPQYRVPTAGQVDGGHATIRRHNMKSLNVLQPTPANRPNHLPVQHNGAASAPTAPTNTAHNRENIFIPIRRPNSVSPPQDHSGGSSGEFPPDPASSSLDRDLVPNRADSGIFVSPRLSDFHLDLESPYSAPSEDPSWTPPTDLSPLSVTEIAQCLRYIGMKDKVVFRFVEEQIDGTLVQELDATLLKEGFPELNALERKKVLDFVAGWRPKKL